MTYQLKLNTKEYLGIFIVEDELDEKVGDLLYPEGVTLRDEWRETPAGELYDASGKERDHL